MKKLKNFNTNEILLSYLETLLWADGNLDDYAILDISIDSFEKSLTDILNFIKEIEKSNEAIKEANTYTEQMLGHNFLLSRNHHGAGFFDDYNDLLQSISGLFKEVNAYVGDDKLIYID